MSSPSADDWGSTGQGGSGAFDAGETATAALEFLDNDRYEDLELIGIGGMGSVHRAWDRRLGRDVAVKLVRADTPIAERRLAAEAQITARLDHPGIVPVYDVGRTPGGVPFFAMRLIRGRTFGELVASSGSGTGVAPGEVLGKVLRHFVDACETVAFAHSRGVVHLDLKPSNIMVGPFGETQVTDWGLARELPLEARPGPHPGTRAYMSPEQRSGAAVDERADVWSLGAILRDVLRGGGEPSDAGQSRSDPASDASPELVAISCRALADDRDARYPDAGALAADLLRWFDGRLVDAYDYSRADLLRRFVREWRVPILLGGAALASVTVIGSLAFQRTAHERDVARRAESNAVLARDEAEAAEAKAERNLGAALLGRARDALEVSDRAVAEVLAARGLGMGDPLVARGVLAAFGASPRPRRGPRIEPEGCSTLRPSAGGDGFSCVTDSEVRAYSGTGSLLAAAPVVAQQSVHLDAGRLAWLDDQERLWVSQAPGEPRVATERFIGPGAIRSAGRDWLVRASTRSLATYRVSTGARADLHPCDSTRLAGVATRRDGEVLTVCGDGELTRIALDARQPPVNLGALPVEGGVPLSFAVDDEWTRLATGSANGELFVFALDGPDARVNASPVRAPTGHEAAIDSLAFEPGGRRLVAVNSLGRVSVFDLPSAAWVAHFPPAGTRSARWLAPDELQLIGSSVDRWTLVPGTRPTRFAGPGGVADLGAARDAPLVAQAYGDGTVSVRDLGTGQAVREFHWQDGVAKAVALSPDGRHLFASNIQEPHLVTVDLHTGVERVLPGGSARRVLWLEHGVLAFRYGRDVSWYPGSETGLAPAIHLASTRADDAEASLDGSWAAFVDMEGGIWRVRPPQAPTRIATVPLASALVPLGDDRILIAQGRSVHLLDGARLIRDRLPPFETDVYDLVLSPDGSRIALGTLGGEVAVVSATSFEPELRLRAHDNRVSTLAFDHDGDLLSGSWDGTTRIWALDAPGSDDLEREWGLDLDAAFATRAP